LPAKLREVPRYRTRDGRHSVDRSRDGRARADARQQDAARWENHIHCGRKSKGPHCQSSPGATGAVGPELVAIGRIRSFAHPGGNIIGFYGFGLELSAKRLQVLKDAFPAISRVAALWNPAGSTLVRQTIEEAALTLGLELSTIEVATPDQLPGGFEAAVAGGATALAVLPDAMFWNERVRIVTLAAKHRMPAIYPEREYVDEGGLFAYGPDIPDHWRHIRATYVDKILRGEKPGDLPIQQPTKFELVINLKTARALGLTVPPSILARADEVIE